MSAKTTKKQRREDSHQGGDSAAASMAVNDEGDGTTLAAILAEMKNHMSSVQNEMDDMKGRLSRMDELENEVDGMKSRLSHMDELETKCKAQGEKIKELEARCGCLERSTQILIKENKWKYSAPSIPTSYWIERGFDEDYIGDMEYFLRDIKEKTCLLRSGNVIEDDIIYLGGCESLLLHDNKLLPHWEEFANALQLYNPNVLNELSIGYVQLTSSVMDLLASALKGKPFKIIHFNNNEFAIAREGIGFAVKIVGDNPKLEQLNWVNNEIERMEDARYLVDAVISHPCIDKVRLENCFGDDINGYEILRHLLASDKNFSHIDLERNNIRTGENTAISDYIATNPPLKKLFLADNHLDDDDAMLIARSLKHNTNLKHLRLDNNEITEIGSASLSNAVYDSTSLNSMADCNHSCTITGIDTPVNIFGNHPDIIPKGNRAHKIYHLLSKRNQEGSNVHHLNLEFDHEDDSLALVPNVLVSVHGYSSIFGRNPVHPLSITYEILRSWKMPELYENGSGVPNKVAYETYEEILL